MININWFVNELKIYQELSFFFTVASGYVVGKLKLLQKVDFYKLRKEVSDYRLFNKATCMNNKYFTNHIRCFMRI